MCHNKTALNGGQIVSNGIRLILVVIANSPKSQISLNLVTRGR